MRVAFGDAWNLHPGSPETAARVPSLRPFPFHRLRTAVVNPLLLGHSRFALAPQNTLLLAIGRAQRRRRIPQPTIRFPTALFPLADPAVLAANRLRVTARLMLDDAHLERGHRSSFPRFTPAPHPQLVPVPQPVRMPVTPPRIAPRPMQTHHPRTRGPHRRQKQPYNDSYSQQRASDRRTSM